MRATPLPKQVLALSLLLAAVLAPACSETPQPQDLTGGPGADAGGTGGDTNVGPGGTCKTGGGGIGFDCIPKIEVREVASGTTMKSGKTVAVNAGDLGVGKDKAFVFSIANTGNAGLSVSKIDLAYEIKSPDEAGAPAFTCVGPDGTTACADMKWPVVNPASLGGTTQTEFEVRFRKYDDQKRVAVVTIKSNDKSGEGGATELKIVFSTESGLARIKVQPEEIDFGFQTVGGDKLKDSKVFNVGNADLTVAAMDLSSLDAALFTVVLLGKEYPAGAMVTFPEALRIAPGESIDLKVVYKALDDKPHKGDIVLHSNDPSLTTEGGPGLKRVPVKVNSTGPCLLVLPKHVVFGGVALGVTKSLSVVLKSCGDAPVEIRHIAFDDKGGGEFDVDFKSLPGGTAPSADKPAVIPVNGELQLFLTYTPADLNKTGADGTVEADKATAVLKTNTALGESKVTMEGFGSSSDCPTAIITVQEGDTVVPQTVLHLDGKQSYDDIDKYEWEVIQPKGSVGLFQPNAKSSAVQFTPNVAGDYKFLLHVYDKQGKKSCYPAERTVKVLPDQAIHVELLWKTPGDNDESDEGPGAGSDLDLHFAHQYASGQDFDKDGTPDPWFADTYDCFWFNKNPEWGSYDPNIDDNPSLDRDDTDGAGPENLNLTLPEDGKLYKVGVHYFNDFGKGPSQATVRIYVYGLLQWELTSTNLNKGDLWFAATIDWPQGEISGVKGKNGPFAITPKYPHPEL